MSTVAYTDLMRLVDRELAARDLGRTDLWQLSSERHGDLPGSWARRAYRWERDQGGRVPLDRADQVLVVAGLHLNDLDITDEPAPERRRRGGGHPTGVYGYLTGTQLRALHVAYQQGMSLRQLAAQILPRTKYASVKSCSMGIQQGFIRLGLERRDRIEATRNASTVHGLARRGNVDPAHRRALKVARGEILDRPQCAGHKTTYPGRGRPCRALAMTGSRYCAQHAPERQDQVREHLARARSRQAVTA
jgi:hypothetical protein